MGRDVVNLVTLPGYSERRIGPYLTGTVDYSGEQARGLLAVCILRAAKCHTLTRWRVIFPINSGLHSIPGCASSLPSLNAVPLIN